MIPAGVREVILRALSNHRGDDHVRAERAFRGLTAEQMREQHGYSGKTRQEILDDYRKRVDQVDGAVRWIQGQEVQQ